LEQEIITILLLELSVLLTVIYSVYLFLHAVSWQSLMSLAGQSTCTWTGSEWTRVSQEN